MQSIIEAYAAKLKELYGNARRPQPPAAPLNSGRRSPPQGRRPGESPCPLALARCGNTCGTDQTMPCIGITSTL